MQHDAIVTLQRELGFIDNQLSGTLDDQTLAAMRQLLQLHSAKITKPDWQSWPAERKAVLALQLACKQAGCPPGQLDGWWGPQTDYACSQLSVIQQQGKPAAAWRDHLTTPANPHQWPLDRDAELVAYYGEPGSGLVKVSLPYPLRLAWDLSTTVITTQCHQKVAASFQRVLEQVILYYGFETVQSLRLDLYGGGFNLRNKRGGSSMSTHSWGIAFDFDPAHNQLKWGRNQAAFAQPEYDYWWQCWESEGWVSLGRSRNFDWMHVQAARL